MTAQQVYESAETQRVFREADAAGIFEEAGAPRRTDAQDRLAPGLPDSDTQTFRPLSRLHLHNRALRFVMKRLLRDLWVVAHAG